MILSILVFWARKAYFINRDSYEVYRLSIQKSKEQKNKRKREMEFEEAEYSYSPLEEDEPSSRNYTTLVQC